jgi:hypothetical protein
MQIIEFFNLKSPNFFKFRIDIETISPFLIIVKLGYKLQNFQNRFSDTLMVSMTQHFVAGSQVHAGSRRPQLA